MNEKWQKKGKMERKFFSVSTICMYVGRYIYMPGFPIACLCGGEGGGDGAPPLKNEASHLKNTPPPPR